MNISAAAASKITVRISVQDATSTKEVLAQVNAALRQRARILERSDTPRLQALADNMWRVRSEIIQLIV